MGKTELEIILLSIYAAVLSYMVFRLYLGEKQKKYEDALPLDVPIIVAKETDIPLPGHPLSAGLDLKAVRFITYYDKQNNEQAINPTKNSFQLFPGYRLLVSTSIKVDIPEGYELQIRSRSGLALKEGVVVFNSPGTIDPGYQGEVGIILHNSSEEVVIICLGQRVAQGVIAKTEKINFKLTHEFRKSERGESGFGSSGK